ncbi:carboxypeptidase regulatory-like domain-containing protein, partial [Gemmatimonadota bacterium]
MGVALMVSPEEGAGQTPPSGAMEGRVWDEEGLPVFGALLRLFLPGSDLPVRGAEADELGYFHLEPVAPGVYRLEVGRLGFATQVRDVEVGVGQRLTVDFILVTQAVALEGINVEAERSRERIRFEETAGETVRELAGTEIKAIPGLVEADPLRAVEVLPGVVTTSDFSSAFNVRGGSADQNLILLDGLPVFNPTHLGGFFSVFNADLIRRAELRSGGFPARFGGRVSSVLDIRTDPGDGGFQGDAGLSLLATRLALGGGLPGSWKEKAGLRNAQWRLSGRRSYFDQILKPVMDFPYHLTDLQGAFEGWTRGGNRISITAYKGRDVLDLTQLESESFPLRIDWDWGNDILGGRLTHPRSDGGWWEVRTGYSRFATGLFFPDFDDTQVRSAIDQGTLAWDLEVRPTPFLTLTMGTG